MNKEDKTNLILGDLVSRTGLDIHRVTSIDDEYYFGEFTCLHDSGDIYDVGEAEGNMCGRYDKINIDSYPELYKIAKRNGWLRT